MSLFTLNGTSRFIYVPHPPRTGGRFLRHLLIENNWIHYYTNHDAIYKGQELPHCDLSRYQDFIDIDKVKILGVVRNPLDRYISILSILKNYDGKELERWKYSNCFTPQSDFFPENSYIWKFEDGFNKNFISWLENLLQTNLPIVPHVPKMDFDNFQKIKSTLELETFCSVFYRQDYVRFYHENQI